MTQPPSIRPCARCCGVVFDVFRWVRDIVTGLFMALLGVFLFGHRPRACKPTAVSTSAGECYGCGRASRYHNPRWFAPLCRECTIQEDDDRHDVLCRMGNDPRFSLPLGLSLPGLTTAILLLAAGLVALLSAAEIISLPWDSPRPRKAPRQPISLERLFIGDEKIREARKNARKRPEKGKADTDEAPAPPRTTATGARMATTLKYPPVPSALERFQKIKSGPTDTPDVPQTIPVPKPVFSKPVAPETETTTPPPAKDDEE